MNKLSLKGFLVSFTILLFLVGCSPELNLTNDHFEIYVGQDFNALDFVDSETKAEKDLVINSSADLSVPGTYDIVYSLGDTEMILQLTVKEDPISLLTSNVTLELGSVFDALSFVSEEDRIYDIHISHNVDISNEGSYIVNYEYDGIEKSLAVLISKPILIPKLDKIVIDLGAILDPKQYIETNFPNSESLIINDNVNIQKVGTYSIVYTLNDTKFEIPVVVKDVSPILTKTNVTVSYGTKFNPKDYLVESDKNNNEIIISDNVNTNIPGNYEVIYSLGSISKVVEVIVKEKVIVQREKIQVISITSPISAGSNATIKIKGTPNTNYSITVHYKSGPSTADGLNNKSSDSEGYVEWTWKVGSRTSSGSWRIVISSSVDSITEYFTVY